MYLDQIDMPPKFKDKTLKSFDADNLDDPTVVEKLKKFGINIMEHRDKGTWVLLTGQYGIGKTHLAAATLRRALMAEAIMDAQEEAETGVPPRYGSEKGNIYIMVNANEYLRKIKSTYNGAGNAHEIIYKYRHARLLVLDDLGAESKSEHQKEKLHDLLNYRYDHEAPTIITSNLDISGIGKHAGSRLADRIIEQTSQGEYIFSLSGESYRQQKRPS